jgi:hypothetical protein
MEIKRDPHFRPPYRAKHQKLPFPGKTPKERKAKPKPGPETEMRPQKIR